MGAMVRSRSFASAEIRMTGPTDTEKANIECRYGDDGCELVLTHHEIEYRAVEFDFFESFCRVRERLDARGIRPYCYGASLNVYPSSMARDMGRGLKPYRLKLGEPSEEVVSIFDDGDDVEPSSVEEQRAFYESWVRSVRLPSPKRWWQLWTR